MSGWLAGRPLQIQGVYKQVLLEQFVCYLAGYEIGYTNSDTVITLSLSLSNAYTQLSRSVFFWLSYLTLSCLKHSLYHLYIPKQQTIEVRPHREETTYLERGREIYSVKFVLTWTAKTTSNSEEKFIVEISQNFIAIIN